MRRIDALKLIMKKISDDDIAVFCNGIISREGFMIKDRPGNFYMLGSMGHASMIGLGVAQNIKTKVLVFDGDGNFFMNPGGAAMIGAEKPTNLVHIIFDNKKYQTTGGQPTISQSLDIAQIGIAFNYSCIKRINNLSQLEKLAKMLYKSQYGQYLLKIIKEERI